MTGSGGIVEIQGTAEREPFSEDEFTALLNHSVEIFEQQGLGRPTSFRAGGWTADAKVLRALGRAGFIADTSANNWARMEEWKDQANGLLYQWNKENWSEIGDTSQPYYISEADIQKGGMPHIGLLEVPDNGALVDYITGQALLPLGGMLIALFAGWWMKSNVLTEELGMSETAFKLWRLLVRFLCPLGIGWVLASAWF